jgi:hypothetical protein
MGPIPAEGRAGQIGRRRFLRWLLRFSVVSTVAMVLTPILGFLIPPKTQGAGGGDKCR